MKPDAPEGIYCTGCRQTLPFTNFVKSQRTGKGQRGVCRDCQKERNRFCTVNITKEVRDAVNESMARIKADVPPLIGSLSTGQFISDALALGLPLMEARTKKAFEGLRNTQEASDGA
ncbi:MAG: hypothetical protein ACYTFZ_09595 [Planctomycetota bacterium]|jgi:hypothetical protein